MSVQPHTMLCPHCHAHTELAPALIDMSAYVGRAMHIPAKWESKKSGVWWIGSCRRCEHVVLAHGERAENIYPTPRPAPSDERIPDHIRRDLDEAKLCMTVGAFRASLTMARRSIQAACLLKGATERKTLYEQIDELEAARAITPDLKTWAHEVRHLGNDGAHPPKDYANDVVEKDDAEDVLELAEQFLEAVFVTPALAEERRKKRTAATP
jgi:hypothetical protein